MRLALSVLLGLALLAILGAAVVGCDKRAGVPYHSHPTAPPADSTDHDDDD